MRVDKQPTGALIRSSSHQAKRKPHPRYLLQLVLYDEASIVGGTAFHFRIGRRRRSTGDEEIATIQTAICDLLAGEWMDKNSTKRAMREEDIIVVAVYNLQVNALCAELPKGVRVGTLDKFQGRQAPVCIVSMTASSADNIPRGMEFCFCSTTSTSRYRAQRRWRWYSARRDYAKQKAIQWSKCGW